LEDVNMATVTCIKPLGANLTVGKDYDVISNTGRGIIAIKNDDGNTHLILNTNLSWNKAKLDFFYEYFVMDSLQMQEYLGSTRGKKGTSDNLGW